MNAHTFLMYTASGVIVSWVPMLFGVFVSHRKLKRHIDKVTSTQTGEFKEITNEQTDELLPARRLRRPGV